MIITLLFQATNIQQNRSFVKGFMKFLLAWEPTNYDFNLTIWNRIVKFQNEFSQKNGEFLRNMAVSQLLLAVDAIVSWKQNK